MRIAQHRAAAESEVALGLARAFVAGKVCNQRTLLRRNHAAPDPVVLGELEAMAKKAERAESIPSLLGIEGTAARYYFGAFAGMLKGAAAQSFDLEGRNRRPPRDLVNAALSLAYSLLTKDCVLAVAAVGMDPLLGFLHQPRFGRPALALDLMEEMRPLVADSVAQVHRGVRATNGSTRDTPGVRISALVPACARGTGALTRARVDRRDCGVPGISNAVRSTMHQTYVVTYDVREPKRLPRVYRVMLGYGEHVQYSVFRCGLSDRELVELKGKLRTVIHHWEDRVLFIDVGPMEGHTVGAFASMGQACVHEERRAIVV